MIHDRDFVSDARSMKVACRDNEARQRSIISRLYYGAYHRLASYADQAGYQYRSGDNMGRHEHMVQFLVSANHDNEEVVEAIEGFQTLRGRRIDADYKLSRSISFGDVEDSVTLAEHIIEVLDISE